VSDAISDWTTDGRKFARHEALVVGKFLVGADEFDCKLFDISVDGARLVLDGKAAIGTNMVLDLGDHGAFNGEVIWRRRGEIGIKFLGDVVDVTAIMKKLKA